MDRLDRQPCEASGVLKELPKAKTRAGRNVIVVVEKGGVTKLLTRTAIPADVVSTKVRNAT